MKNCKLFKSFILIFILAVASAIPFISFADTEISVFVNDRKIEFDINPQIIDDRTMIPFRYVANAFGAEVDYAETEDKKTVTASLNGKTVYLTIGSTAVVVEENGKHKEITSDVAPVIVPGDRTVVPVRLIAETFGYAVGWNGGEKQVIIITADKLLEKFSTSGKGIYNSIFDMDAEKFMGEYSFEFSTKNNGVFATINIDEQAVFCDIFMGDDFMEIATTDELVYTRFNSTDSKDWKVVKIEEFAKNNSLEYSKSMITDTVIKEFITNYTELNPSASAYSNLDSILTELCSDGCDSAIGKTGTDTDFTVSLSTESELKIQLEKTVEKSEFKSLSIKGSGEYADFKISIKRDKETASVTLPTIQ